MQGKDASVTSRKGLADIVCLAKAEGTPSIRPEFEELFTLVLDALECDEPLHDETMPQLLDEIFEQLIPTKRTKALSAFEGGLGSIIKPSPEKTAAYVAGFGELLDKGANEDELRRLITARYKSESVAGILRDIAAEKESKKRRYLLAALWSPGRMSTNDRTPRRSYVENAESGGLPPGTVAVLDALELHIKKHRSQYESRIIELDYQVLEEGSEFQFGDKADRDDLPCDSGIGGYKPTPKPRMESLSRHQRRLKRKIEFLLYIILGLVLATALTAVMVSRYDAREGTRLVLDSGPDNNPISTVDDSYTWNFEQSSRIVASFRPVRLDIPPDHFTADLELPDLKVNCISTEAPTVSWLVKIGTNPPTRQGQLSNSRPSAHIDIPLGSDPVLSITISATVEGTPNCTPLNFAIMKPKLTSAK